MHLPPISTGATLSLHYTGPGRVKVSFNYLKQIFMKEVPMAELKRQFTDRLVHNLMKLFI